MSAVLEYYKKYRSGTALAKLSSHLAASSVVGMVLGIVLFRRSKFLRTVPFIMASSFSVGYNYPHYKTTTKWMVESVKKTAKDQFSSKSRVSSKQKP